MSKLKATIASIGQNIQFVAFAAHLGIAALIVEHSAWPVATCLVGLAAAGAKEFYFDARYEKNPPQTFVDNAEDFAGYAAGLLLGLLLSGLRA